MQEIVVGSRQISLGKLIGKGGEGKVYSLDSSSGAAAKLYHSRLRVEREEKVRAIVKGGFAAKTDLVAYPREVVSDSRGRFLGFLMQFVSGYQPIHQLYSPKSRQRHFPEVDYRFIIRSALNVARAIGKVHQTGCVIGDINHSGILVSHDSKIALIDADSFQFHLEYKTYPCVVGVPDFMPPELHGENLTSLVRSVDHDNFGLAVAIFHLLFMGRHPYAGLHEGPDLSIGEAIAQNRFAFSLQRQSSTRARPPPRALTLDVFPTPVREAFENAFGSNPKVRPSAATWMRTLTLLEGSLIRCSSVRTHFYPDSAKECLWCDLSRKASGFDMFPDLATVAPELLHHTLPIERAIREIRGFRGPVVADLFPQSIVLAQTGTRDLQNAKRAKIKRALIGLLMLAGSGAGFFFVASIWYVWIGLAGWGTVLVGNRKVDQKPFQDAFVKAEEELQRELSAFVQRIGLTRVAIVRGELEFAINSYHSISSDLSEGLVKLKSTRESRQRAAFLDQFAIQSANIAGIGPVRKATLASFGIETAADVTRSAVLQVPGFGDAITDNLLEWRGRHESRFRYNPTRNLQDNADERRLRAQLAKRKADLETTIRNGLEALRAEKPKIDALPEKAVNDEILSGLLEVRLRAEQDLRLLGAPIPNSELMSRPLLQPKLRPQSPKSPSSRPRQPSRSNASQRSPNCPRCGSRMRRKSGMYGMFWGCSHYPTCRGTRNI